MADLVTTSQHMPLKSVWIVEMTEFDDVTILGVYVSEGLANIAVEQLELTAKPYQNFYATEQELHYEYTCIE